MKPILNLTDGALRKNWRRRPHRIENHPHQLRFRVMGYERSSGKLVSEGYISLLQENNDGSKSQRVDIHYKFIGYVDINELIGLPMVIPMENNIDAEGEMKTGVG